MYYDLVGAPLENQESGNLNYNWPSDYSMVNTLTNEEYNKKPNQPFSSLEPNSQYEYPSSSGPYISPDAGISTQQYVLQSHMIPQENAQALNSLSRDPYVNVKPQVLSPSVETQQFMKEGMRNPPRMIEEDEESDYSEMIMPQKQDDTMLLLIAIGILILLYVLYKGGYIFQ